MPNTKKLDDAKLEWKRRKDLGENVALNTTQDAEGNILTANVVVIPEEEP